MPTENSDRPQHSVVQFYSFEKRVLNKLIGHGQFTAPRFNSFDLSLNQIKDTLKEQYEKELKAREETIQRLQDIIDKSIGGFVSLSRPAEADRSSYYEGESPTTPSIQAAFKPELLSRYFFLFKKSKNRKKTSKIIYLEVFKTRATDT